MLSKGDEKFNNFLQKQKLGALSSNSITFVIHDHIFEQPELKS